VVLFGGEGGRERAGERGGGRGGGEEGGGRERGGGYKIRIRQYKLRFEYVKKAFDLFV
jgi:hypothetical protein